VEESSGWDQTLFCGAMRQNKRQEAQTETVEVEHEEKLLYFQGRQSTGTGCLERL